MGLRSQLPGRKPGGRIRFPANGSAVPRLFRAEGTVENLPASKQLLLAVEVAGLMWPKAQVQTIDGAWSAEVHEDGAPPDGRSALSLYMTSTEGYGEVAAWLERGRLTGDYPGLGRSRDGIKLHSIRLRLKRP